MQLSQLYLKNILEHPSMPNSTHLPNYCTVVEHDSFCSNEDTSNGNNSDTTIGNDNSVDHITHFKTSYMPPEESPLGIYLEEVKRQVTKFPNLKKQKYIYPKNTSICNLGSKPSPFKFYTDVLVYNFDPKHLYPTLNIKYQCIHCGCTDLFFKGKRFRPAYSGSKIDWIMYDRYQCKSESCKGGKGRNRVFGTIDPMFMKLLPYPISDNFNYLFPNRGPGINVDMVKTLSIFTDKHVLFSAFAKCVNNLQWEYYYKKTNAYCYLLDHWLGAWPSVDGYNNNVPLLAQGYDGSAIIPYSAFGESGYHHGITMTENYARSIFLLLEGNAAREKYVQNSFQAWHDDGMTVDDTHKITKKVFVNTSGRTRV